MPTITRGGTDVEEAVCARRYRRSSRASSPVAVGPAAPPPSRRSSARPSFPPVRRHVCSDGFPTPRPKRTPSSPAGRPRGVVYFRPRRSSARRPAAPTRRNDAVSRVHAHTFGAARRVFIDARRSAAVKRSVAIASSPLSRVLSLFRFRRARRETRLQSPFRPFLRVTTGSLVDGPRAHDS